MIRPIPYVVIAAPVETDPGPRITRVEHYHLAVTTAARTLHHDRAILKSHTALIDHPVAVAAHFVPRAVITTVVVTAVYVT